MYSKKNINKKIQDKKIKIMYLGGVSEIGKNMTAIEYGNNIYIIDCGSSFPNFEMPGIDLIIPDFQYIVQNKNKIRALLITHGHEDHIGALPYFLKQIGTRVPIYASKLTMALINSKLDLNNIKHTKQFIVEDGTSVKINGTNITFIAVNHSIEGALSIAFKTHLGYIFHTGDFKIDFTPLSNKTCDLTRLAKIGMEGVLLLMSESTNVEKPGYTISERKVIESFLKIFEMNPENRIIIATFASNFHRIIEIIKIANANNKKCVLMGTSMQKVYKIFLDLKIIEENDLDVIEVEEIKNYKDNEICILCTGAQGEPMAALQQMLRNKSNCPINITYNDLVIISSSPIPGNEYAINNLINKLYKAGAEVIYGSIQEIHVSGHACQEELKLMLSLLKPKFFVPVHGEYRHLHKHIKLAKSLNIGIKQCEQVAIGDVIDITNDRIQKYEGTIPAGSVYIDGKSQDTDTRLIEDRKILSKDGLLLLLIKYKKELNKTIFDVEFIEKGINVLNTNSIKQIKKIISSMLLKSKNIEKESIMIQKKIIYRVSNYLKETNKKRPYIIPIILDKDSE